MRTNTYNSDERLSIANTMYAQIGGGRFSMMTGCKPIGIKEEDNKVVVVFNLTRNATSCNRFNIAYNEGKDVYEMSFYREVFSKKTWETKVDVKKVYNEVYCDMLESLFTNYTNLVTRF